MIETLSGAPLMEMQRARDEEERIMADVKKFRDAGAALPADLSAAAMPSKSLRVVSKSRKFTGAEETITIDHLQKLNQKNVSAWNMKRLVNMVRYGNLSTLDEQITESGEDESSMHIQSEYEAKMAAKKIFTNVAEPGSK